MSKLQALTFKDFTGLDFRTTQKGVSFYGKNNDIGYVDFRARIKKGIAHLDRNYSSNVRMLARIFEEAGVLYGVSYSYGTGDATLYYWTGSSRSILNSSMALADFNNKHLRDIIKTKGIQSGGTSLSGVTQYDNYITTSTSLTKNALVGKYLVATGSPTGRGKVYYITGNDTTTIYIDGYIDISGGGSVSRTYCTAVDGYLRNGGIDVAFYDNLTSPTGPYVGNVEGKLHKFGDRIVAVESKIDFPGGENKIKISPLYIGFYGDGRYSEIPLNYTPYDSINYMEKIYVFTDGGVYRLSGTGITTFEFVKVSNFSTTERVYPVALNDTLFINVNGQIRTFSDDGLGQTIYNYNLIPDTDGQIFASRDSIIFPLGHTDGHYGELYIEEITNNKKNCITVFGNGQSNATNIKDMVDYKGQLFFISGTDTYVNNSYRENGTYSEIKIQTNTIDVPRTLRLDNIVLEVSDGTLPDNIYMYINGAYTTIQKNTEGGITNYPINTYADNFAIVVYAYANVIKFTLYYK